jgi:DNA-binding NarL/FixJ family response regulator
MRHVFSSSPNLKVIAYAKSKDEVLPLADDHRPQIAVLDLEVEWTVLIGLVTKLAHRHTATLVVSEGVGDARSVELLRTGASGIISPRASAEMLCRSVHASARGEIWVSRRVTSHLIERLRIQVGEANAIGRPQEERPPVTENAQAPISRRNHFGLTPRELEIVRAIGEAMTNKDIAAYLGISQYTVKHHLSKIFDKLGVDSRLELAIKAQHHGLICDVAEGVA